MKRDLTVRAADPRRRHLLLAAISGMTSTLHSQATAAEYPAKPLRILVGFAPGGGADIAARLLAQPLSDKLKTQVYVENRPGANTLLAIQALKASPADGYTLLFGTAGALVQSPGVQPNPAYDPAKDFTPVAMIGYAHGVLSVRSSFPAQTFQEFIEHVRKNPGKVTFGSAGVGSASHLPLEYLMLQNKLQMTHVPYQGDSQVVLDLVSERIDVSMNNVSTVAQFWQQRKLRSLGVSSSSRLAQLAGVPTYAESGNEALTNLGPLTFYAFMGPAGLPDPIVLKLNTAVNEVLQSDEVGKRLAGAGIEAAPATPESLRAFIRDELAKWGRLSGKVKLN